MVAGKAMDFAALFNHAFSGGLPSTMGAPPGGPGYAPMPPPVAFRIELTTPAGPSTAGGRQALQHVRLVPAVSGPAIVIGSVNTKDQRAELRTHRLVAENYAARFKGAELPIDPARYGELLGRLQQFLSLQGIQVATTAVSSSIMPPPMEGAVAEAPAGSATPWVILAIGAAFVVLIAVGVFLVLWA